MRNTTRHVGGGFAAGLFTAVAIASMLGTRPQEGGAAPRPRINPQVEALLKQIKEAEDHLAEAQTQLAFWQQEQTFEAGEVARMQNDAAASPAIAFYLGQTQGLYSRAVNSSLDARLNQTMCSRKVQALKAELSAQ